MISALTKQMTTIITNRFNLKGPQRKFAITLNRKKIEKKDFPKNSDFLAP